MAPQLSPKRALVEPTIPDRLYFKIGDVARICQVETYVLRFWETQFPQLKPNKSGTGQRLYRRRDVETALEIKRLVHGQGYTLVGARQAMNQSRRTPAATAAGPEAAPVAASEEAAPVPRKLAGDAAAVVAAARNELREIMSLLAAPTGSDAANEAAEASATPRRKPRVRASQQTTDLLFPC